MNHLTAFIAGIVMLVAVNSVDAQKTMYIIGSSTSACTTVNSVTECYVGRLSAFYDMAAPQDTFVNNSLALGGTNCFNGMPTGYIPPYSEGGFQPIPDRNITYALAKHADVILVNYPTNAYDVLPVDSILFCLRTIRNTAVSAGVPCFVTTSQPRTAPGNFNTPAQKLKMAEVKDRVLAEFGAFAIDFWTGLINPADSSILYDSGDNIHMNATGHQLLFQRIQEKNVFAGTAAGLLPATFLQFNAVYQNSTAVVSWTTTRETDVAFYEIQRSADGIGFSKLATLHAVNAAGNNKYQYTDNQPLKGLNYYKILVSDRNGQQHASPVMRVRNNIGKLSILKAFASSSVQVAVELQNNEQQNIQLQVFNSMGMLICKTSQRIDAGSNLVYIHTPALSNGVYHIQLVSATGESMLGSFIKN